MVQTTESLWVRQSTQTSVGDIGMGVCYRLAIRKKQCMMPSGGWKKPHICRRLVLVLWRTLATLIFIERITQQCISNPDGLWSALMIITS